MSRHGDLFRDLSEGANPIGYEILREAADSLNLSGERLQKSLHELSNCDLSVNPTSVQREALIAAAAEAFWGYAVQRELLGLLDVDYIAQVYQVPQEVRRRAGI